MFWLIKKFVKWMTLTVLAFLLVCFVTYQIILINVPDCIFLIDQNPELTSYMINDEEYLSQKNPHEIKFTPINEISPSLIKAVLSSEDDLFFVHDGFNFEQIIRAFEINWRKNKYARGGSTITQQLARNLFLNKDKTMFRKLREVLLVFRLEQTLDKVRILELYLNYAEFGPGIYGIGEAARYHFKTTPKNLSPTQAALLAAMLPNPKRYGHKPYPGYTYKRQRIILARMNKFDLHFPEHFKLYQKKRAQSKTVKKTVQNDSNIPANTSDIKINVQEPQTINQNPIEFLDE